MDGSMFLVLYVFLFPLAVAATLYVRHHLRAPHDDDGVASLHPYEHAYLAGGEGRALATAIGSLDARGVIRVETETGKPSMRQGNNVDLESLDALERVIVQNATGGILDHEAAKRLRLLPELATLRERLERRALLLDDAGAFPVRAATGLIFVALAAVGALRMFHGLNIGAPIGFTFVLTMIAVAAALWMFTRTTIRTVRGENLLQRLNERARRDVGARDENEAVERITRAIAADGPGAVPMLATALAIFAVGTGFNRDGSGGGCGDGGGGDGGGCGGCGGCG